MKRLWLGFLGWVLLFAVALAQEGTNAASGNPSAVGSLDEMIKACDDGDLAKVKLLVGQGVPVDAAWGKYGFTPLIEAASKGHLDVLQYLIDQKANLDLPDVEGSTPLLHACWENHTDCALALIEAGERVNYGSNAGRTPLMYAAQKGNDEIVAALIAHKAKLDASGSWGAAPAISWAAANNKLSTVKLLAEAGAGLTFPLSDDGAREGLSLLGEAAAYHNMEMLDYLIGRGMDVETPSSKGSTALMIAASWGYADIARRLLDQGAKVDVQNVAGETALMRARNVEVLQLLLQHGAGLEIKDKKGRTALLCRAIQDDAEGVKALLEKGADIDAVDAQGETALTLAANLSWVAMVDILKSAGAKRTDVHIVARDAPDVALPPGGAWALALAVFYTQRDGNNPRVLGGEADVESEGTMLKRDWGITDHASLIKDLDGLRDRGHRLGYQDEGAAAAAYSDDEIATMLKNHPEIPPAKLKAERASYLKWKDRSGLAWDLCRAANLANLGFACHYLNEQEAWDRLLGIAKEAQANFSSWQELSDNFLDGREIWAGKRDPGFEALAQMLLNPQDANSPWNQNPWKTDLGAAPGK